MYESIGINENEVNLNGKKIREIRSQLLKNVSKAKVVIPFTMYGGFKDFSEMGELGSLNKIDDHAAYQRVFTGASSVVAIGDDSVSLVNTNNKLEKQFKVGDYKVGISFSTNITSNVDNFSDGKEFTEMHDTETITVVMPGSDFSEKDMYKVFVIPQETQRGLRITNVNRIKDSYGELVFCEVTFSSFNDAIESTGIANFNYIQKAAIGENYAGPIVEGDEVKHQILGGEGVNEYQIEFMGNVLVHGVGFIGRDANKTEIKEPKWLLTSDMLTPIESKVKRISAAENNLLLLRDCKFTEKTYFKKGKEEMAQGYDATIRKQFEGMISFDNKTTQLNKDVADKNFGDKTVTFDLTGGAITYDGFASPYVRKNFSVTNETVPGLLNRNMLSHSGMTQLPQEVEETIAGRAADIPVIGKTLDFFSVGIPGGGKRSNTLMKAKGLNFLGSRAQALMYSTAIFAVDTSTAGTEIGLLPAEAFDNTDENPIGKITASQSVSIVLRGKLTDTVTNGGVDKDTATMKTTSNTFDEHATAKTVNNKYGYVDKHVINAVGKADYIVTYFRDGVRVGSSRYQTTGKGTNNIRDGLNFVSYSPGSEFEADQKGLNGNHIEELPAPQGSSFYEPKTFFSAERRVDAVGGGGTNIDHEIKWQITKNIGDRFSKIVIPGLTNVQFIDKTAFEAMDGMNVHNFAPTSNIYPNTVTLTVDKSDATYVTVTIRYISAPSITNSQYQAFVRALGNQLLELTLYNEGA